MKKIFRGDGSSENLSEEVYRIVDGSELRVLVPTHYENGTLVRLISGVDNNQTPGHHFLSDYATVCRVKAVVAEFIGIKCRFLEKVDGIPVDPIETSGFRLMGEIPRLFGQTTEEIILNDGWEYSVWKAVEQHDPKNYGISYNGKVFEFARLPLPGDKWWAGISETPT